MKANPKPTVEPNAVVIEDWWLVFVKEEGVVLGVVVNGKVSRHPTLPSPEGRKPPYLLETSAIDHVDGRLVYTHNSVYRLGTPAQVHRWLLKERGLRWSEKHPIPDGLIQKNLAAVA